MIHWKKYIATKTTLPGNLNETKKQNIMNSRNVVLKKIIFRRNKLFNFTKDNFRQTESMKQILTELAITQAGHKSAFLISINDFESCLEKIQTLVS